MAQNVANTHDHLGHGHHVEEAKHELEVHGDAARQEREAYYQRERRKLQINEMLCCTLTRFVVSQESSSKLSPSFCRLLASS